MKSFLYKTASKIIKGLYQGKITHKPFNRFRNLHLFYEVDQHLVFFGKKLIFYEEKIVDQLIKYISNDALVFDIGCNIGQYMSIFSQLASNGKIVCFEPDPKNYAFATFNKNINLLSNVIILNLGVGKKTDQITYYKDSLTGGRRGSFIKEFVGNSYTGENTTINIKSYDQLVSLYGIPDFVKIDVEGYEAEIIQGITALNPNTIFFIEVREKTKKQIFDFFISRKFSCLLFSNNLLEKVESSDLIPPFANLLFLKNL